MTIKIVDYDEGYPIHIHDGWGGEACVSLEGAKELLKDLEKVIEVIETLENPIDKTKALRCDNV